MPSSTFEAPPANASARSRTQDEAPHASAELDITSTPEGPALTKVKCSQIDADRARKLSERFNLRIEPSEWTAARAEKEAYRIKKPIRMRVHRTCHQCNITFGANKVCASCQHSRCLQCPRYPPRKEKAEDKPKEVETIAGGIEVDDYSDLRKEKILTLPSRTGGQPLVRKTPRQRARRTCHQCSTMFASGCKICTFCNHARCVDCPRDP